MKERYEVVTAVSATYATRSGCLEGKGSQWGTIQAHEKYERELALANEKIKRLQDECK